MEGNIILDFLFSGEVIATFILLVLTINTLRDVIRAVGWVPRGCKYSGIIYGKYDESLLISVFKELGVNKKSVEIKLSHLRDGENLQYPVSKLIALLSKYIFKFDEELDYGKMTVVSSNYYINTMEASHNTEDLNLMCILINKLIKSNYDTKYPDFILTPKNGNPILGKKFAEINRIISIIGKASDDNSRARVDQSNPEVFSKLFLMNFEGSQELFKKLKKENEKGKSFWGVAIDCNASGASSLLKMIDEFNNIMQLSEYNVEKVQHAYILFRPDTKEDVDKKFSEKDYKLYRYFDLNEDLKADLYAQKGDKEYLNLYTEDKQQINMFKGKLEENDLIKTKEN